MFYVLAILIVLAALATLVAPTVRLVLLAVMAGDVLVGVLLIVSGAYLLGAVAMLAPALCLAGVALLLRRAGYAPLLADVPGLARGWPLAVGASAAVGIILLWTTATRVVDTAHSASGPDLLTVLHYRTPVALGVMLVLAAAAVLGGLLIGRVGDDERALDRHAEQRRLREQRSRQRREHRAAARAQRGAARDGGR